MKSVGVYGPAEITRLFQADRLEALIIVAVATGLRAGELFGLAWSDVDLTAGALSVRHTLEEIKGQLALKEPKSAKGRRLVALPQVAVAALWRHRATMLAEGHLDGPVFCDTEGGYLRRSNFLRDSYHPLLKRAQLPHLKFHGLRHTSATLLLAQGAHPKIVQERLGHSQISLTLDTYSHVLPTMQKDAAAKLNDLLAGSGS